MCFLLITNSLKPGAKPWFMWPWSQSLAWWKDEKQCWIIMKLWRDTIDTSPVRLLVFAKQTIHNRLMCCSERGWEKRKKNKPCCSMVYNRGPAVLIWAYSCLYDCFWCSYCLPSFSILIPLNPTSRGRWAGFFWRFLRLKEVLLSPLLLSVCSRGIVGCSSGCIHSRTNKFLHIYQ